MRQITIALAQTNPAMYQVERNVSEVSQIVERICAQRHVDLIIFPELSTTGYDCGLDFPKLAERNDGQTVSRMLDLAERLGVHILLGMAQKRRIESVVYSAAVLCSPDGKLVGEYQKVHLKGEQRLAFRPGYRFMTVETPMGRLGMLVGWDLAFPEAARSLALDGAELICVCGAWETPHVQAWRTFAFARALENSVFVAACNRVGEEPSYSFFGESLVIGPGGRVIAHLEGDEPGVLFASIDLDQVSLAQERTQIIQARQPRSYRSLVKMY